MREDGESAYLHGARENRGRIGGDPIARALKLGAQTGTACKGAEREKCKMLKRSEKHVHVRAEK